MGMTAAITKGHDMNEILTKSVNPTASTGKFEAWLYGLINAVIMGGSTSVTTWLGMAAAKGAGLDVPALNLQAVGVIFVSGAMVKFFLYLSAGLPNLNASGDQVSNTTNKP